MAAVQAPKTTIPIGEVGGRAVAQNPEFSRFFSAIERALVPVAQRETPADGANVQMTDDSRSGFLRIQGAGPLAALSITHPTDARSVDGQVRTVYFDVAVAALTWPESSATLPSSAAAGDRVITQRLAAGEWAG